MLCFGGAQTYVTDRIIAMGYPSEGTEGVYRNKLTSVQRFFARRHPNSFRLYNLCSERFYDVTKFDGCVARFPFDVCTPCVLCAVLCRGVVLFQTKRLTHSLTHSYAV